MTREEIKYASKDYVNYLLDKQEYHNENYTEDDIRQAFEKGAMLANNNPDTSSPWHDASEEPECRDGGILCEHDLYYWVATKPYLFTIYGNWHNKVKREHLTRWAYISDLLPKKRDK